MKKILIIILLTMFGFSSKAEQISSVETSGNWIYMYNLRIPDEVRSPFPVISVHSVDGFMAQS